MQPQLVVPDFQGFHNSNLDSGARLLKSQTYQDLSTIIICPTRGSIPAKVVQSWMGMMRPMNQKIFGPVFAIGLEVAEAYNQMISSILNDPNLKNFRYIMTIEEDNMPPVDGLMKLYESMDNFDVVGGLYWTKGEAGQPMIYGDPKVHPKNFIPQMPVTGQLQECNGLGMGFNLFKMEVFKKMPNPWFKTVQHFEPGVGVKAYTQDLYFYEEAAKFGFRFACDNRVLVGHLDVENDIIW